VVEDLRTRSLSFGGFTVFVRSLTLALAFSLYAAAAHAQTTPAAPSQAAETSSETKTGTSASMAVSTSRPMFKSGVELVAVNVVVTDSKQNYVTDLSESDFTVYEDGVPQDLAFFASSSLPLDLAILLDTSASMISRLSTVQDAAINFVRTLRPGDRGRVVAFNSRITVAADLGEDIGELQSVIRRTNAQGSTGLYKALYVALRDFEKRLRTETEVRRRAIVVLTDGDDTSSIIRFDDVLKLAQRTGVGIYTIGLTSQYGNVQRGERRHPSASDFGMKTLALETGAQSYFPNGIEDLSGVYDRIAVELANQYALAFAPKNTKPDGVFRRLVVRILSRPGLQLRARLGYFLDAIGNRE
jgi:Ca-activated chloride channel family protein